MSSLPRGTRAIHPIVLPAQNPIKVFSSATTVPTTLEAHRGNGVTIRPIHPFKAELRRRGPNVDSGRAIQPRGVIELVSVAGGTHEKFAHLMDGSVPSSPVAEEIPINLNEVSAKGLSLSRRLSPVHALSAATAMVVLPAVVFAAPYAPHRTSWIFKMWLASFWEHQAELCFTFVFMSMVFAAVPLLFGLMNSKCNDLRLYFVSDVSKCPGCRYNLGSLLKNEESGVTCPECGLYSNGELRKFPKVPHWFVEFGISVSSMIRTTWSTFLGIRFWRDFQSSPLNPLAAVNYLLIRLVLGHVIFALWSGSHKAYLILTVTRVNSSIPPTDPTNAFLATALWPYTHNAGAVMLSCLVWMLPGVLFPWVVFAALNRQFSKLKVPTSLFFRMSIYSYWWLVPFFLHNASYKIETQRLLYLTPGVMEFSRGGFTLFFIIMGNYFYQWGAALYLNGVKGRHFAISIAILAALSLGWVAATREYLSPFLESLGL